MVLPKRKRASQENGRLSQKCKKNSDLRCDENEGHGLSRNDPEKNSLINNLKKENIDKVIGIFPRSSQMDSVKNFLYNLETLMSFSNNELKTKQQIEDIKGQLREMCANLRSAHPTYTVNVKLHLVNAHLPDFVQSHHSWGRLTEQPVEHVHADFNKLHLTLAAMKDPVAKGYAFINAFSNANYLTDIGEAWNI